MEESRGHRFIGRTDELRILHNAARTAARGIPRVVTVSGATGMGKTALVEHFTDTVAKEFTVLKAWDIPPKSDLPFYTVTGLLADGTEHLSPPAPEAVGPQPSVLDIGGAVIDLLDSSQETSPVLFWLDDAHRVDLESLQSIGFALLRQDAERILTVICTREAARTARNMGLKDLVPASDHIEVSGFTMSETREFIEDRTARPHSEAKLRGLAVWSHGNPLFLEAALGSYGGNLPDDPAAIDVPSSLSDAVGAWSRSFPPGSRDILNMLAVLDAPATVALLGRLLDSESAGSDAEILVDQHAAMWLPDRVPTLRLVHIGQRDALYAAIPRRERNRMHLRAARLLEPSAAWRHRVAATETYDAALARDLLGAAAREARAGRTALAADHLLASSQVDPDGRRRQDALLSAVRLQVTGGQPRTALRHEEAVLAAAPGPQRDEALGLLNLAKGRDALAASYLNRAREAFTARGDLAQAAYAAAELGVAQGSLGLGQQALSASEFALRHARDDVVRGLAVANRAYGHALLGGPVAGLRHLDRLSAHPSQVPATHTDSLIYRGLFRALSGDLARAVSDLSAAARRREVGVSRISSVTALTHSLWCHLALGEWDEARRNVSVALDIAHTTGRPADFFNLHCFVAVLHAFSGRREQARVALREALSLETSADFSGPGFHLAATRATVAFAAEDFEETVAVLAPVVDESVNTGRSRLYAMRHLPVLGVASARTGDLGRARSVLRELEAAQPHGALVRVVVHWVGGAIAAVDDPAGAVASYEAGLAVPPHGGDPVAYKALMRQDLGALLLATGDTERAREQLRTAEKVFTRLGAARYLQRCRALLEDAGTAAQPAAAGFWETLSDRERDIAGLVGLGWTNREIAARLCLSTKTVEYHLGNIYMKNDIRGRRELRDLMQSRQG
ncbi:AAA family ATPase (plasmid) [Streptomyces sp. HUAS 31]|nr:LuxR family transcriptional regulator [Streptomyces sp. HUAS 31]WCE02446.1 AAA family ATPase [Streptomyces sp. HUAS 31]